MPMTAPRTCDAPVDGHEIYDEIHGSGLPLALLHGPSPPDQAGSADRASVEDRDP